MSVYICLYLHSCAYVFGCMVVHVYLYESFCMHVFVYTCLRVRMQMSVRL